MGTFFTNIYDFFLGKRKLLWIVLATLVSLFTYCAFQINFNTNIKNMMPENEITASMNQYVLDADHSNKLIFQLNFKDSTYQNSDSLIIIKHQLDSTIQSTCARWIQPSKQLNEDDPNQLIDIVLNYLPIFLDSADYITITKSIQENAIGNYLEEQKQLLQTPSGSFISNILSKDPIGISNIVFQKFNHLRQQSDLQMKDGVLMSADEQSILFIINSAFKSNETGKNKELITSIDSIINQFEYLYPQIDFVYFGGPAVGVGNATQMQKDTILTLSISIIALLAITWYVFKRKRITFILFTPVLFGVLFALSCSYWIKGSISLLALGVGAIILGIALDFSIHFLSHARSATSIRKNISELANPLTLGAFTTIGAFFILTFANAPILQDLGWFAASGLLGASLFTLIFLPHLVKHPIANKQRSNFIDKLASYKPEKNKWLLVFIIILTPILWHYSQRVSFDSNLMHMNYMSPTLQASETKISKHIDFTLGNIFIINKSNNQHQLKENDQFINNKIQELQSNGHIRYGINPAQLLPIQEIQEARILQWQKFWNSELITKTQNNIRLACIQAGFNVQLAADFNPNLLINTLKEDSTSYDFLAQMHPFTYQKDAEGNYVSVSQLKVEPGQRNAVFHSFENKDAIIITDNQHINEQLLHFINADFNNLLFYSGLLVFLALLIAYGRIELAIISFLPMALSWIWILGLMSILNVQFNFINIIICTLIFGLGDDYSIFMMDSLIQKYKTGKYKIREARSAVYLSAITTLIGLGVLIFAKHPALQSIAFIAVVGLSSVVFIAQVVQPFLFNVLIQNRANKGKMPFTLLSFALSVFSFAYFLLGCLVVTTCGLLLIGIKPFGKKKSKYLFHLLLSNATKSVLYIMMNVTKKVTIKDQSVFDTPKVYIANHTSFLDILIITMVHPKMILLTADWVWNSPVFGKIVRMAEYYPVIQGAEKSVDQLQQLVNKGYSIAVFPEGTRSSTDTIHRFKKGAFYMAQQLNIDIVPIVIHGAQYTMEKNDFLLKNGTIRITIHPPISIERSFQNDYTKASKDVVKFMRQALKNDINAFEIPKYYKEQLTTSYLYKGPVVEWYCKVKIKMENYYTVFNDILPKKGNIYDLGCGLGFMTYMLHWANKERHFISVDYDSEKIAIAQHNYYFKSPIYLELQEKSKYPYNHAFHRPLTFIAHDITLLKLQECDAIIISDALHYLTVSQQWELMDKSMHALIKGGTLIIRDGIKEFVERHQKTIQTEVLSTKIFKFNKTQNDLNFLSKEAIIEWAKKHQYHLEVLDIDKKLSNLILIITKP